MVRCSIRRLGVGTACMVCLALCAGAGQAAPLDELNALKERFDAHFAVGRYREAEPIARRLLQIAERAFQNRPEYIAVSLNNLALVLCEQGRHAEAEPLYQRSLKISEKLHGIEHPAVAESVNNLAVLYDAQGRYAEAEPLYLRCLRIFEKVHGPEHPTVAATLENIALLYSAQGRYSEAEPLYLRGLQIREKVRGPEHRDVAASLNSLAGHYRDQGRYVDAEPLYRRSLRIRERVLGPMHPLVAESLNNLALLYSDLGRYAEAEPLCLRTLQIREEVLGPKHPLVADSLNNLAICYRHQGRNVDAEPLYRRSLEIRKEVLGPEHPIVAQSLSNLANLYRDQGRYAEAEPLYQRSLQIFEKVHGPDHPDMARMLNDLASLYRNQGRYAEAEPLIDRAIAIRDGAGVAARLRSDSYNVRSNLYWDTDRKDEALDDLNTVLNLADSQRGQLGGTGQQRSQASERFAYAYERMIRWQRELDNVPAAFAAAERGRARGLVEEITAAGVDLLAGVPKDEAQRLRGRERETQGRVASLERQLELFDAQRDLNEAADEQQRRQLLAELADARQEVVDAYAAIRNASPAYRQAVGRDFRPLTLDEVQRELAGDGNLVLEYVLGGGAGYLFVIPPNGQTVRIDTLEVNDEQAAALGVEPGPLTADRMREILTNEDRSGTLDLLRDPSSSTAATDKQAMLWQLLIPEAEREKLASGEYERLILLPDGALTMLPFEALIVEQSVAPVYLLDVGPPILYGPSATVLVNLKNSDRTSHITDRKPVLTVGDPRYGGTSQMASADSALDELAARGRYRSAGGTLKALPYSGVESRWILEVFGKQGIATGQLIGADATEAKVRFNVAGRRVVHLACHGLADQQHGNFFGALALAPGAVRSGSKDDGYLTLPEIYELDLAGCELAILSACETNVGPQQRGEGVWALSRGFLVAGSRRVVASNWLVDDEGAASLISVFAAQVARGEGGEEPLDHAAALHEAKKWVRRQAKWQSPYYWATFVLVGPS